MATVKTITRSTNRHVFLLALVLYDLVALRRLHPATLWGGLFLVTTQWLRVTLADTAGWMAVAEWLTR